MVSFKPLILKRIWNSRNPRTTKQPGKPIQAQNSVMSGACWHFTPTFWWNPLIKAVSRRILYDGNNTIFFQQSPHAGSSWASWRVGAYRLQKGCRSWEDNNNRQDGDLQNPSVLLRKSEPSGLTEGLHHGCALALENFGMEKQTLSFISPLRTAPRRQLTLYFSLLNNSMWSFHLSRVRTGRRGKK